MSVYLRAAKMTDSLAVGCCYLIVRENRIPITYKDDKNIQNFADYFCPEYLDKDTYWFSYPNKENQFIRSLALLFMHEISKDENNE